MKWLSTCKISRYILDCTTNGVKRDEALATPFYVDRCWRIMIMDELLTGGEPELWCTKWCVAGYHSIIVIMTFCLNLSCYNKLNFLGLCQRMLPPCYQVCWSRTPNQGQWWGSEVKCQGCVPITKVQTVWVR